MGFSCSDIICLSMAALALYVILGTHAIQLLRAEWDLTVPVTSLITWPFKLARYCTKRIYTVRHIKRVCDVAYMPVEGWILIVKRALRDPQAEQMAALNRFVDFMKPFVVRAANWKHDDRQKACELLTAAGFELLALAHFSDSTCGGNYCHPNGCFIANAVKASEGQALLKSLRQLDDEAVAVVTVGSPLHTQLLARKRAKPAVKA